jgi:diguanylate cyclase (GGDEF)-like protein
MALVSLLAFIVLVSIGFIILNMLRLNRNNRLKNRQAILETYQMRSTITAGQKINELGRRFLGSLGRHSRKNLLLEIVQDFKNCFNLGRFAIFELDGNEFVPIMSSGLNLKSIRAFKVNLQEINERKKSPVNRLKNTLFDTWPFGQTDSQSLAMLANYPDDILVPFVYYYKTDGPAMLFLGEDPDKELARYCLLDEFNSYVWPELYDLFKHCSHINKIQNKIRGTDFRENRARNNNEPANGRNKTGTVNPQPMLDIANKLFSALNANRLIEIYTEYISSLFSISNIAIFTPTEGKSFIAAQLVGRFDNSMRGLELLDKSEIYDLIMNRKTARVMPLASSQTRPENPSDAVIYDNRFAILCRINTNERVSAAIFLSGHKEGRSFNETELSLLANITNIAGLAMDNIERYCLVEKLSYTDSMTELYNYRYFYKRLSEEIYRAKRFNRDLALVIFDIDNFKAINDSFGHQAGDEILKSMSNLVLSSVRAIDVVSRYGGEEFCIIMPDTGNASCQIFIERLRTMIAEYKFEGEKFAKPYEITVSCGGAIYPIDAQTTDRLIYCADMALLKAKSGGRNRSVMYDSEIPNQDCVKNNYMDNENMSENKDEV